MSVAQIKAEWAEQDRAAVMLNIRRRLSFSAASYMYDHHRHHRPCLGGSCESEIEYGGDTWVHYRCQRHKKTGDLVARYQRILRVRLARLEQCVQ